MNNAHNYKDLRRFSNSDYQKLRNSSQRIWSHRLRPFYDFIARILSKSHNHFVLNLDKKNPKIYNINQTDAARHIAIQIEANVRKIDSGTNIKNWKSHRLPPILNQFSKHFKGSMPIRILCHGARNGSECVAFKESFQQHFNLSEEQICVVGTDVSPTAPDFGLIIHDMNQPLPLSLGLFDIIYSTSLDQSQTPWIALQEWLKCLNPNGSIYLEWTRNHGNKSSSLLDPFSCETELFPFAVLRMLGENAYVSEFLPFDRNDSRNGVFVIKPFKT